MATFASVDEARKYFEADRFAMVNGMQIDELFDGGCVCSMTIGENHLNVHGGVMGGAVFTLADFAFAVAANNDKAHTIGLHSSIEWLSGAKGTKLFARAVRVKSGRTTCVYEVTVTDDTGRKTALFIGTGFTLN